MVVELVSAGQVDLDDPIDEHLTWLEGSSASIEQLLTHTSGYAAIDGLRVSERFDNRPGALRRAAADLERTGEPGQYAYSSANYLLLGALIEEVTGSPYATHVESELFEPLGMTNTAVTAADAADLPPGHRIWWGHARTYDPGFDESGVSYGYMTSTLADLERYAVAQSGGATDVLSSRLLSQMQQPRVRSSRDHYGYGWQISGDGDDRRVHHTGANPGYFAHLMMTTGGSCVVLLANSYSEGSALALHDAADDILAISAGESAQPGGRDPMMRAAPWVLAGLVLVGAVAGIASWWRPRRRPVRLLLAAMSVLVAVALWLLPGYFAIDLQVMRTWLPDVALTTIVGMVTWGITAVLLLLPVSRTRPHG